MTVAEIVFVVMVLGIGISMILAVRRDKQRMRDDYNERARVRKEEEEEKAQLYYVWHAEKNGMVFIQRHKDKGDTGIRFFLKFSNIENMELKGATAKIQNIVGRKNYTFTPTFADEDAAQTLFKELSWEL